MQWLIVILCLVCVQCLRGWSCYCARLRLRCGFDQCGAGGGRLRSEHKGVGRRMAS